MLIHVLPEVMGLCMIVAGPGCETVGVGQLKSSTVVFKGGCSNGGSQGSVNHDHLGQFLEGPDNGDQNTEAVGETIVL